MTATTPGSTQSVDPGSRLGEPSITRLAAIVRTLAGDEFTGRRIGTPGGRAAVAWLSRHLEPLGATMTLDRFTAGGTREAYATPTLTWSDGTTSYQLTHRRDFAEHLASADLPTARVGALALADHADLAGRWLLAPAYTAGLATMAVTGGAAGLLVPRGTDSDGWMPKMIAGPAPVGVPVLAVRTDLHQQMTSAATAGIGTVRASVPLRTVQVTGTNIHAVFAAPANGAVSVLLTAHYDGVGDDPQLRHPAAADNASGVAVVIEAARLLTPTLPTGIGLAVALLDGEEIGAKGSAHHAPQLPPDTLVINVDGAAELHEAASVEAGGPAHSLLAALDQAGRQTGVPLRAGAMASDNRRYAAEGLAAVGIGMGMPGYQTPAETPDRVQAATLIAATRLVIATVMHLTGAPTAH